MTAAQRAKYPKNVAGLFGKSSQVNEKKKKKANDLPPPSLRVFSTITVDRKSHISHHKRRISRAVGWLTISTISRQLVNSWLGI